MLTIKEFNSLPDGEIFATGILPNSPEGLFMNRDGGNLRWIAIKGLGYDWCIYCHWDYHDEEWISQRGDKVHNTLHIKMCVPCDDDVFARYRT